MSKILRYIFLGSILLLFFSESVFANDTTTVSPNDSTRKKLNGIIIETDIVPIVRTVLLGHDIYRYQVNLQVNLLDKYFPVIETGVAGTNSEGADQLRYNADGVFVKAGLDIPAMKPKDGSSSQQNFFLVGFRFGATHFGYSYNNLTFPDNYWGKGEMIEKTSHNATKFWLELAGGIRVNVYKNIYMGWSIKNNILINKSKAGETAPWYIPGYGIENGGRWNMSYLVGYKF